MGDIPPNFCGRLRFDPRTAHRPAIASRREMGQTNVSADKAPIDPLRIYIQAERFLSPMKSYEAARF